LEVIEGHKPWVGDRVWISLNKIGLQNVKRSPLFSFPFHRHCGPTNRSLALARIHPPKHIRKFDIGRNKNAYDTLDFGTKVRSSCFLVFLLSRSLAHQPSCIG
jgi:hypothetical protein